MPFYHRECNECTCSKGSIRCDKKSCGNPIPKGCWVHNDDKYRCEFVSPCPKLAVFNGTSHCLEDTGKPFCLSDDCNACFCDPSLTGRFKCFDAACPKPTVRTGAWHSDCRSKKCVFVHSNKLPTISTADRVLPAALDKDG